jgi:hypothetical protein
MTILDRYANLDVLPQVIPSSSTHVSLGDLHGNALKLIYVMIEEGVLELRYKGEESLPKEDLESLMKQRYRVIRDIYEKPVDSLTKKDLKQFAEIIGKVTINNKKDITLIGDELADRGSNDYFTLLVLQKLKREKVNMEILISNHSAEFLRDYEKRQFTGASFLAPDQAQSLFNMQWLMSRGLIDETEVRKMVTESYMPMVKAIGYTLSEAGDITLFSHTPIGLETVKSLANKFGVIYNDQSPIELILTIDAINVEIQNLFVKKELAGSIDNEGHTDPRRPIPPATHPLHRLVWNRAVGNELITKPAGNFKVHFVHGHIGDGEVLKNYYESLDTHQNIDSTFGKPGFKKTGVYLGNLEVRHLTRHSSDISANELNNRYLKEKLPLKLKQLDREAKQLDSEFERLNNEFKQLEEGLRKTIDVLLEELKEKTDKLIKKGESHSNYNAVKGSASILMGALDAAKGNLFTGKFSLEKLNLFEEACKTAVSAAKKEFVKHRGLWGQLHPILKGFLGIIAVIPGLIASAFSKFEYTNTFFASPPTDSAKKLHNFEKSLETQIMKIQSKEALAQAISNNRSAHEAIKDKAKELQREAGVDETAAPKSPATR